MAHCNKDCSLDKRISVTRLHEWGHLFQNESDALKRTTHGIFRDYNQTTSERNRSVSPKVDNSNSSTATTRTNRHENKSIPTSFAFEQSYSSKLNLVLSKCRMVSNTDHFHFTYFCARLCFG